MGILLGVLVGVQGTAAYQSAYDKAVNIVTPGNISSEIGEDFPNPPTIVPDKDIDIAKYGCQTILLDRTRPVQTVMYVWLSDIQTAILEKLLL